MTAVLTTFGTTCKCGTQTFLAVCGLCGKLFMSTNQDRARLALYDHAHDDHRDLAFGPCVVSPADVEVVK